MEYEVRFYFSKNKLDYIISKLKNMDNITYAERNYEKTMQFDHPMESLSFYSKDIDGRFRIRITKNDYNSKCKISWKRRLKNTTDDTVNKEEEVEINIKYEEFENLMFIINNVLKMKSIESYERYRTTFCNEEVEISVDEYPFAIALEIENKSNTKDPVEVVELWTKKLGLDIKNAYRLSWDDKYSELCKEQNIKHYNHVTFNLPMPEIIDKTTNNN